MHQFVFPAVFIQEKDDSYTAMIPDLGLVTDGPSIEEAFLFAKDYLRVFCKYAVKLEEDILIPTKFEKVVLNNKKNLVMLIDTIVE
ncbi:MAG: type II toxin-antitoxin system HicB family antitoxin [Clostridia bacterium]|nr:type II toxin-antitoxin system HicB family antitoxin [Clostridia bacterium]